MIRDWLSRLTAAFAGFAVLGAAPAPQPAAAAPHGHPAMWKVADADTTIYLFGTHPSAAARAAPGARRRSTRRSPRPTSWCWRSAISTTAPRIAAIADEARHGAGLPPLAERVPAGEERRR